MVSSATGVGHGTLRALEERGSWRDFGPADIRDPRGVRRRADDQRIVVNEPFGIRLLNLAGSSLTRIALPSGLEPGGGAFAPNGAYYFGSRTHRSLERVDLTTQQYCGTAVALDEIAFPRGFAILGDGTFVVASGTHPISGSGRRALLRYRANGELEDDAFVEDPALDPLDVGLYNEQLYVTSEFPFGAGDATTSLRRYDARTGALTGVWSAENVPAFKELRKPRGIAFSENGALVLCAQNCVLAIDVEKFDTAVVLATDDLLAGQSLALAPGFDPWYSPV